MSPAFQVLSCRHDAANGVARLATMVVGMCRCDDIVLMLMTMVMRMAMLM